MEKKKIIRAGIAGLAGAVLLGAGMFFSTHVYIDREFFSKNATVFDLTDHDLSGEEYLDICQQFPDAEILWTVPFQGDRYPMDTESITITSLTEADARNLVHLHNLKQIDATQCADYAALAFLQEYLPDCSVLYQFPTSGNLRSDAQHLTVVDADAAELAQMLPLLPDLRSLTLEGILPETETLLGLQATFPSLEMHFTMNLGGQEVTVGAKSVDLSGASLTKQGLADALPLFAGTKEIVLRNTALTDAELKALISQFPDIFFLCDLDFAGKPFSTDSTEIDISGCPISVEEVEALLPCFPRLTKLDMSHCGIENEAMDALNHRYPDISIVWTLKIGLVTVRTDDTIFYPASVQEFNLPSNEELQKLRYCTEMIAIDIGHSKATDCEWVRYLPKLKYLILADTNISDLSPLSDAKELVYLEVFSTDLHDYTPLLGCTSLQDLNIGSTLANPEPLSKMTWLHTLCWYGAVNHPDYRDGALKLQEQLSDTTVVLDSWKNVGGIWRYLPNYYVFRELLDADFFNQEYTKKFWDNTDAGKILACDHGRQPFSGDVLAQIVRYRIDNKMPIPGIKNIGSEKAEILYQTLCNSQSWYQQ